MERRPNLRRKRSEDDWESVKPEEANQGNSSAAVGSIAQLDIAYKANSSDRPMVSPSSTMVKDEERIDYARGLCKDFHETGYCAFGEECIFMHDRTTWMDTADQLQAEWSEQKRRNLGLEALRKGTISQSDTNKKSKKEEQKEDEEEEEKESNEKNKKESFDSRNRLNLCLGCGKAAPSLLTPCKHGLCQPCALKHAARCPHCQCPVEGKYTILKRPTR